MAEQKTQKLLLLIAGCAVLSACEARIESRPTESVDQPFPLGVVVDSSRHVVCYTVNTPYSQSNGGVAMSCLPLDSTNSHAIGR